MTAMVLMLACHTVRPQCEWPFHGHWLSAAHSLNMNTFLKSALSVALAVLASYSTAAPAHSSAAARWLEAHRDRPPMLRQFVQRMPKGADLHHHYSGAIYAEQYLGWVEQKGYCIDKRSYRIEIEPARIAERAARARLAGGTAGASVSFSRSMSVP